MEPAAIDLTLQFSKKLDHLHLTTETARLVCGSIRTCNADFIDDVELAVSEACTNAIKHARQSDGDNTATIRFRAYTDRLVVEVVDRGMVFDMESVPLPRFDEHPESGYGMYIIRTIMDEVGYEAGDICSTLTMTKFFDTTAIRDGRRASTDEPLVPRGR